jgi:hypothetical protein
MAKYDPDKACEQAIAESAVEVRQWTSSNADAVISTNYYLQIGERFYGAGAPQVWLHGLEEGLETDNPEESLTLVDGMIVQLPEDEAKRQEVVRVFREEAEEFEVEEPSPYIGKRFVYLHTME